MSLLTHTYVCFFLCVYVSYIVCIYDRSDALIVAPKSQHNSDVMFVIHNVTICYTYK